MKRYISPAVIVLGSVFLFEGSNVSYCLAYIEIIAGALKGAMWITKYLPRSEDISYSEAHEDKDSFFFKRSFTLRKERR